VQDYTTILLANYKVRLHIIEQIITVSVFCCFAVSVFSTTVLALKFHNGHRRSTWSS